MYFPSTGNSWLNRKHFVKHPNKFYPLEIDYGQDDEELKTTIAPGSKSLLPSPVQELIKMIFDVESMKKTLVEFEVSEQIRSWKGNFITSKLPSQAMRSETKTYYDLLAVISSPAYGAYVCIGF